MAFLASHELIEFREALRRLQADLQEASRPSRFKPPTDLSLVEISLNRDAETPGTPGEIIDLSPEGMKIALAGSHPVQPGQACLIKAGNPESRVFNLSGTVRWVESHSLVTVFGILLDGAEG